MKKISTKITLAIVLTSTMIITSMGLIMNNKMHKVILETAKENLKNIATIHGQDMDLKIQRIELMTDSLEAMIVKSKGINEAIKDKEKMNKFKDDMQDPFLGVIKTFNNESGWIIFNSEVVDGGHILSFSKKDNKYVRDADYDAVADGYSKDEWWSKAVLNGDNWSKPYFWEAWNSDVISYSKAVYLDGKLLGVAGGELFFTPLKKELEKTKIYENGYMALMDRDFNFLYHPRKEFKNLRQVDSGKLSFVADEMKNSKEKVGSILYKLEGQEKVLAFYKLGNGWLVTSNPITNEMYKDLITIRTLIITLGIILMIVAIIISLILGKSISSQVVVFMEKFKISSSGDLKVRVEPKTKDELGVLGIEFNSFMVKLESIIRNIKDVFEEIEVENKQISYSIDNLAKGKNSKFFDQLDEKLDSGISQLQDSMEKVLDNVRNQAANTQESLAALEQISATTGGIGENADKTLEMSKNSVSIAGKSFKSVEKMNGNMVEIQDSVGDANKKIEILIDLSKNIGGIVVVINALSEQTNLLALNASIEAARAGDAGRGFAVVAEEVRKLAEQTNQETEKIKQIILSIQKEVQSVKQANEGVASTVDKGMEIAKIVKTDIQSIIDMINKNDEQIEGITVSTKEQALATEEVTKAVGNIAENAIEVEHIGVETFEIGTKITDVLMGRLDKIQELEELINKLKLELEYFKINN